MSKITTQTPSNSGKPCKSKQVQLAVRVPFDWLQQVNSYVEDHNQGKAVSLLTQTSVVKQCLQIGWDTLTRAHIAEKKNGSKE